MIIVADSHINKNSSSFFKMLDIISTTSEDVVFLGDIFDLWVALPGYEGDFHSRFLEWCKQEKNSRMVGFIEGNHEFYVKGKRDKFFSFVRRDYLKDLQKRYILTHGDLISTGEPLYTLFRLLIRNVFSRAFFRYFPYGPGLAEKIRIKLRKEKRINSNLPLRKIEKFLKKTADKGYQVLISGHFHVESIIQRDNLTFYALPPFQETKRVLYFNTEKLKGSFIDYQDISTVTQKT